MLRFLPLKIFARVLALVCLATSLALLTSTRSAGAAGFAFVGFFALLTATRPYFAALAAAALAPSATSVMLFPVPGGGDWAEMLVLSIVLGWSARALLDGQPLRLGRLIVPWTILALAVAASLVVQLLVARTVLSPEAFYPELADALANYATHTAGIPRVLHAAARLLEGLFLLAFVMSVGAQPGRADALVRACAVGAAGGALFTFLRLGESAAHRTAPFAAFVQLVRTVRFSYPYSDVNAAGSYYALTLPVLAGCAIVSSRMPRIAWLAATILCAAALWVSGSRAAVLAVVGVFAVFALWRTSRRTAPATLLGLAALAALVIWLFPNPILDRSAAGALGVRLELARASWRMLRLDPVFGIGIGQYYDRSAAYILDPAVKATYLRENAHNNYLQIATELGIPALVCLVALVWMVLRGCVPAWRTFAPPLQGAALGIAAFLVTCLAGHPLLTSEVSIAFWMLLGCIAVAAPAAAPAPTRTRMPLYVAAAAVLVLAVSVPWRVHRDLAIADLEHVGHGVSMWHHDESGRPYREMLHDATLFVPRYAQAVELSYRLGKPGSPVTLELQFRGRVADRLVVREDEWRERRIVVPADRSMALFTPLTIKVVDGDPTTVWLGKLVTIGMRE